MENLDKYLQYYIKHSTGQIVFVKNTVGASITPDGYGIQLPGNYKILIYVAASTGPNSYGLGIFPDSNKLFAIDKCSFSFYPAASSRIFCTYIMEKTDKIYIRTLTLKSPYSHPQYIINYRDTPENDIIVNCIFFTKY